MVKNAQLFTLPRVPSVVISLCLNTNYNIGSNCPENSWDTPGYVDDECPRSWKTIPVLLFVPEVGQGKQSSFC